MRRLTAHFTFLTIAIVAAVFVAACSTAATPTPATPTAPAGAGAGGVTVATAADATLGTILTGADGRTLYILTKDSANTSTCSGSCATTWPPLVVPAGSSATAGSGVTGLGTLTRSDGSTQVTHNGMPLYYFAADSKAGDTKGQGVGGVWFVATPTGSAPAASAPAASQSPSGKPGY